MLYHVLAYIPFYNVEIYQLDSLNKIQSGPKISPKLCCFETKQG